MVHQEDFLNQGYKNILETEIHFTDFWVADTSKKTLRIKLSSDSKIQLKTLSPVTKYFYLLSGFLLVAIGVIGIFLPVLPTTIFLILASVCFVRSSPKANEWLKNHKILGAYIKNYSDKTGLTIKNKIFSISFLWIMILLSAFLFTDELFIRLLLLAIATGVTIHLVTIKTKNADR